MSGIDHEVNGFYLLAQAVDDTCFVGMIVEDIPCHSLVLVFGAIRFRNYAIMEIVTI